MTSWLVTASIAATASGVGGGAARTGATLSAGTTPAAAFASSTRDSTRHQSSYLCASLQTRPISGNVYRSITGSFSRRLARRLIAGNRAGLRGRPAASLDHEHDGQPSGHAGAGPASAAVIRLIAGHPPGGCF